MPSSFWVGCVDGWAIYYSGEGRVKAGSGGLGKLEVKVLGYIDMGEGVKELGEDSCHTGRQEKAAWRRG